MRPTGESRAGRGARRRLALWVAGVVLLAPSLARADGPVRLDYRRAPGAVGCPDAAAFRARVTGRLGHDPFSPAGRRRLEVRLAAGGPGQVATLTLVGENGQVTGVRRLAARRCRDLMPAVALAVTIALAAPEGPPRPRPAPPAARPRPPGRAADPQASALEGILQGPPAPEADPEAPPAPLAPWGPPPVPPRGAEVFFALSGDTGMLPAPSPAVVAGAGVDLGTLSLSLAVSAGVPAVAAVSGGAVSGWDAQGVARACRLFGPLGACAVGRAGVLTLAGLGLVDARSGSVPTGSVGIGARYDWRLRAGVDLRVFADVDAAVVRAVARDTVTGKALWTAPPVFLTLGLAVASWR